MNNELLTIATHIMLICCFVLLYAAVRAYFSEKDRRQFYEKRYYSEPRVYHYKKKKGFWLFRILILIIVPFQMACTKEEEPSVLRCYSCEVNSPGIKKAFDTCLVDIRELDLRNSAGIGLPWVCRDKR